MDKSDSKEYLLSVELHGHAEDVRAVSSLESSIFTGSRDKTVRLWANQEGQYELQALLVGHTDFVTSIATFPKGTLAQCPEAEVLTGSRDLNVVVWDQSAGSPRLRLTGHKYQVSCVAVGQRSEIISTSHDGTIRIYSGPEFQEVTVLSGDQGPIQTVLVLPDGNFLTGGGNGNIKRWADCKCLASYAGHTDTVRGLALFPGIGFVSASHDTTLRVWQISGEIVSELRGHTSLVYAAATSSQSLIASASEDKTARVWTAAGQCLATISHPGCVWDLAFLPNGDLVTGCSDHSARVWTADAARAAPPAAQEAYRAALTSKQPEASSSEAAALPEGLTLEEPAALLQNGSKDGQIKVIKEGSSGMAYSWSASQGQWEKVGQVMGAPAGGDMEVGSSSVDGTQYDHVISVEVDDRPQPLRLGVNQGDNPYNLADEFIAKHGLPESYREQIVQYIVQNTGAKLGLDSVSSNVDPFTGGAAYVPGAPTAAFPQPGQRSSTVTGGGWDPFTGSRQGSSARHLPARTMLRFDALPKPAAVAEKIRTLSASMDFPDCASLLLTEEEAAAGGVLDRLLSSAAAAARAGAAAPQEDEVALLGKLLGWPAGALFPSLDVARMMVLHEPTAARLAKQAGPLELSPLGRRAVLRLPESSSEDCTDICPPLPKLAKESLFIGNLGAALATACAEAQLPPNQQTGLRLVCNTFQSPALQKWLHSQLPALLTGFSPAFSAAHKGARTSSAAFLLNVAVLLHQQPLSEDLRAQAISAVAALLAAAPPDDEESQYRGAVALGTLLEGSARQEACQIATALDAGQLLEKLKASSSSKVIEAAAEARSQLMS